MNQTSKDKKVTGIKGLIRLFGGILMLMFFVVCSSLGAHGQETKNDKKKKNDKPSLFQVIYQMEGRPQIHIQTDVGRLVNKSMKEEYQESNFTLLNDSGNEIVRIPSRVRARGNMRKQVCHIPPVKIDFNKKVLDSLGYLKADKLKFVFPCRDRDTDVQRLAKEFLIYELYAIIDTNNMRAKLVDFVFLEENGDEKYRFMGFMVEDEEEYARRKDAVIVESGKIFSASLDRDPFLKMTFFQYMIANTDWSISEKHNLEIVKLPNESRVRAIPYDFDYCGLVGHSYAIPHEKLPIKSVKERYFFPFSVTDEEFYRTVEYFLSIESRMVAKCDAAEYMEEKTREESKWFINDFFELLKKPDRLKREIVKS